MIHIEEAAYAKGRAEGFAVADKQWRECYERFLYIAEQYCTVDKDKATFQIKFEMILPPGATKRDFADMLWRAFTYENSN